MTKTHAEAMRIFREQAATICKSGTSVLLRCDNHDDACHLFEWLSSINGRYETIDDWLDEIESFSLRRERIENFDTVERWLAEAFQAGCSLTE